MSEKNIPGQNKIFSIREWLSLSEAAQYLTILLGEEVHEVQVLRLALDGKLQLSINFINPVHGQRGQLYSCEDKDNMPPHLVPAIPALMGRFPIEGKIIDLEPDVVEFAGVWDLVMAHGQKHHIESIYQCFFDGPVVVYPDDEDEDKDAWFVRGNGEVLRLFERIKGDPLDPEEEKVEDWEIEELEKYNFCFYPATADFLPKDSELVIRPQALLDLQDYFAQKKINQEKKSGTPCIDSPFSDTSHTFYAQELKVAVEAWTELYEINPPQHVPPGGGIKNTSQNGL